MRSSPVAGEGPGMAANMPRKPAKAPFSSDLPLTEAIRTSDISTREKNSNGPNFLDNSAAGLASASRNNQEIIPPTKDALMPRPSARPGRPPFAMG